MPKTIHFKSLTFHSKYYFLLYPIGKIIITYPHRTDFSSNSHLFHSSPLLLHQTQIPKPVICARKKRRGSGSKKLRKILPQLVSIVASNLKILPEPLGLVIAEFGGGGDGSGFWKAFGDGNSDGWRRKGKKSLGLIGFLVVSGLGLWSLFERELKSEVFYGVLALGLIVTVLINKRQVKDCIFGIFLAGVLMGLRLKKEGLQQWVHRLKVCSPVGWEIVKGKRRNGRRVI